jgi:hypothetical protein
MNVSNGPRQRTLPSLAATLSVRAVIAICIAAIIGLVSTIGCQGPTGPSAAEVEAKARAEEAQRRANEEHLLRQQEAERRSKSEEAAQHYWTMAIVACSIVVFVAGLIIGTSLGLKTRREYASQSRIPDEGNAKSEADSAGGSNDG